MQEKNYFFIVVLSFIVMNFILYSIDLSLLNFSFWMTVLALVLSKTYDFLAKKYNWKEKVNAEVNN